MTTDDYGFISQNDIEQNTEDYGFVPKDIKPKQSFVENVADYGKTILKGTVEGLGKLGKMMSPLQSYEGLSSQEELQEQTESLNYLLPTEDNFGQNAIRRGLQQAPTALSFPGSNLATLPRAMLAGFMGEGAKELGLPEWAQAAAEITAYIGPDVTKKLLSEGKDKEIIEFAKKMGMTDEQITPLIQSEFKQKWLSKITPKRGSTQRSLINTKQGLDESYGLIQKSEIAGKEISEIENGKLINGIYEFINEMPSDVKEKIAGDLNDLLSNKITGRSLMNFYKDVNHQLSANTKELKLLKEPIKKAISSISPELGKDFEMINTLYTKYYPINSRLKPTLVSDLITAGEALGLAGSLVTGYYPTLATIVGEQAAKKIAQQMLVNPYFQQISRKMVTAINENKFNVIKNLSDSLAKHIEKFSPEASEKLRSLSFDEIKSFFSQERSSDTEEDR